MMADYVAAVREVVGMDIPLSADHFGHIEREQLHPPGQGAREVQPLRGSRT